MMNKKLINILFPIIGFIIFIYIIFDIGIEKIAYTFLTIPIIYYLIALSLFVPRLFFTSYKSVFSVSDMNQHSKYGNYRNYAHSYPKQLN